MIYSILRRPARLRRANMLVVLGLAVCLPTGSAVAQVSRSGETQDRRTAGENSIAQAAKRLFARDNLVAWCIVPFDSKKRAPEDRAAMLERLGFRRFAYDWRAEHIPSFDAEIDALVRHKIQLDAFWVAPGELNRESRIILDLLKRRDQKADLWVLLDEGGGAAEGPEQERRVADAAAKLGPLAREAGKIGCSLALYNHGGWFGEPENQIAIIDRLKSQGIVNVGIVYNLHHGHDHVSRFPALLARVMPYLRCLNLNGMDKGGDRQGRKILPLGQGGLDLELLRTICKSGYRGPIGILGHTMDDAEERLKDNLDGLDWLVPQLLERAPGPRPVPRTPVPPALKATPKSEHAAPPKAAATLPQQPPREPVPESSTDAVQLTALLEGARRSGDPLRGAVVFASPKHACISCHMVGGQGGTAGPDLSTVGVCVKPDEIVESVLWPKRRVKEGYAAVTVATADGTVRQGYKLKDTAETIELRDPTSGTTFRIKKGEIEDVRADGTLMPDGLLAAMSPGDQRDLVRFLMDLGRPEGAAAGRLAGHGHAPASFAWNRAPLDPGRWPSWKLPVNRDRVYDFYAKEAAHFAKQPDTGLLLPAFPGLDGGAQGHWGNQNEDTWADSRWNQTDLGRVMAGVFRGAGVTVPKAVCVRLGNRGDELAACFNPETLCYEAVWRGGFVKFSAVRYGIMDGLLLDGTPLQKPEGRAPSQPFVYHGYYRHGDRVLFSYRIGDKEFLDAPWVEQGKFVRIVAERDKHPLAGLTHGGSSLWPDVITTRGELGRQTDWPYVIDTIEPPFENPWKQLLFFGGHDFFKNGTAMLCTIQGDVWRVDGLDQTLNRVRWRRFASGLHQALGLVIAGEQVYVLGRDQITRLVDQNGDGEADFYENFCNRFPTSTGGHDFLCGLERDQAGRFYTASSAQGLLRIAPDGGSFETLATGFRNPDGLGIMPDGTLTVPNSEGEWTPASMVCEVREGGHYGYLGPRNGKAPDLPLVYLPRGLDNSSGSQVAVPTGQFGPLAGQLLHFSFGMGTHFLLLREAIDGQPQGAAIPLPGEFSSGVHRGRINPADGQLYVTGMTGWGSYTAADGCFERVRYTGKPAQLPTGFHVRSNGVLVTFAMPLERGVAERVERYFAQAWNYHYSAGYGSPELSPSHPGQPGHDRWNIRSAHVLSDNRTLFLEIPDLQPVNQLHLRLQPGTEPAFDLFATVHRLGEPFREYSGYVPAAKTIAAHPMLADMAALANPPPPNPWHRKIRGARAITIEAGKNLSFSVRTIKVRTGEPISFTLINPDSVPHNWALLKPGSTARVGELVNKIIAEPDAAVRQYIPRTDDVLYYTDIVGPQDQFSIGFRAPAAPGRYPYICTFPGHWMVMNGEMIVGER
jgi:putative heme-binding domain-containing protein